MPPIAAHVRRLSVAFGLVLGAQPIRAQTYALSGELPRRSDTAADMVGLSPDGTRVVLAIALEGWVGRTDLYSMPVDGSGAPLGLSLRTRGIATQPPPVITADGRVLFESDDALYSVPIDGSQPALLLHDRVHEFRLAPDGVSVVYSAVAFGTFERVFVVPADGSAPSSAISAAFEVHPSYSALELSPDGSRVVFQGRLEAGDVPGLVSARLDGASAPVRLTPLEGSLLENGDWAVAWDSLGVVYRKSQWVPSVAEHIYTLYAVPIDGSLPPVERGGPMIPAGGVAEFFLGSQDDWIVYVADREVDEVFELYAVHAIAGGASVKLNAPLPVGQDVSNVVLSPDGAYVSYFAEANYLVRTDGSAPAALLGGSASASLRAFHADRVVYVSNGSAFSVPLDASAAPVQLTGPHFFEGGCDVGPILSDGTVLLVVQHDLLALQELQRVPIDGSSSAERLAGPFAALANLRVTPAEDRIVYMGAPRSDGVLDTYSVPIDGGTSLHLGQAPLNGDVLGGVSSFSVSADGSRTAYLQPGAVLCVASDGSRRAVALGDGLGGSLEPPSISPDGSRVVYAQRTGSSPQRVFRIFAAPSDGGAEPVLLVGPPAPDVLHVLREIRITPDGASVVFVRADEAGNDLELARVPIDGSAPAHTLYALGADEFFAAPLAAASPLYSFDDASGRIVFAVGSPSIPATNQRGMRLYSVAPGGPAAPLALTAPFTTFHQLWDFTCVAGRVLYLSDQDAFGQMELFGVPADGSAPAQELSQAMGSTRDVTRIGLAPDGTRALFVADAGIDERFELYSTPSDGSGPVVQLSATLVPAGDVLGFAVDPASARVVYRADQEQDGRFELYGVALDGGPVAKLSGVAIGNGVSEYAVGATGVAFVKREGGLEELFGAPLDGSAAPVRLNPPLPSQGRVRRFQLTPGGTRVVLEANHPDRFHTRLFLAPLDGSAPAQALGPVLDGDVEFRVSPDDRRVIYGVDLTGGDLPRLYASLFARPFKSGAR